ncbi:SDR family NAD(P)-dependent oxidoreductase [Nocardiopsis synnemataformans]|uniref:SDR family NAD(P)-dependent oxidoreductase n=1 Tax=Nocardiopsis synnemataformans TaxID=61305 RepID=UPI003EB73EB1
MAAVGATEERVTEVIDALGVAGVVGVAAVNAPDAVVVSGDTEAVERVVAELAGAGCRTRRLTVSHAFHSHHMDAVLKEFAEEISGLGYAEPSIPVVSNVTGRVAETGELTDSGYWARHIRDAVRYADGIRGLQERGVSAFVEIGPDSALISHIDATLNRSEQGQSIPVVVSAQRRDRSETVALVTALAAAHTGGLGLDWKKVFEDLTPRKVALPTYAFRHQHYWPEPSRQPSVVSDDPGNTVDSVFWEAVEGRDAKALAAELGVNGEVQSSLDTVLPALSEWRQRQREQSTVQGWRYDITWKRCSDPGPVHLDGAWILLTSDNADDEESTAVADALVRNGARILPVALTPEQAADPAALAERLRSVLAGSADTDAQQGLSAAGVVSLLGMDEGALPGYPDVPIGLGGTITLWKALADSGVDAPVWVVTRGAVSTGSADVLDSPVQALVWGLGRVAALEYPERWGGLVDLPARPDGRALDRLCAVVSGLDGEDQVAVRASGVHVRRLVRASRPAPGAVWRSRDTALITGGTGGLGARLARWLVANGTGHVVLASRRGPEAPGAEELRAELEGLGARVTIAACDAADREALAGLIERVDTPESPLRTVAHTAGVMHESTLVEQISLDEVAKVSAGKVTGAQNLVDLLNPGSLDAFILYASVSGVWGVGTQGAYAAANAYLDALAHHCRDRGIPATSIAWGPWDEGGMIADTESAEVILQRQGIPPMAPEPALSALHQALGAGDTFSAVADLDWELFAPTFTLTRPSALLRDLPDASRNFFDDDPAPVDTEHSELTQRLGGMSESDRREALLDLVVTYAAAVLGHASAETVPVDQPFQQLGFDSLIAVEFRNHLTNATGLHLPATLVFDHPTPTAVVDHLDTELFSGTEEAPTLGDGDAETRRLLASIPMAKLRSAGLLESLLQLADSSGEPAGAGEEEMEAIRSADIDTLVKRALPGTDL